MAWLDQGDFLYQECLLLALHLCVVALTMGSRALSPSSLSPFFSCPSLNIASHRPLFPVPVSSSYLVRYLPVAAKFMAGNLTWKHTGEAMMAILAEMSSEQARRTQAMNGVSENRTGAP